MAYTRDGWNISVRGPDGSIEPVVASYISNIDGAWKISDVQIKDRGTFAGYLSFEFKNTIAARVTCGFYLNVDELRQYAYWQNTLYAALDWTAGYGYTFDAPFRAFDMGDGRTIDTLKELWIGNVNLGRRYTVDEYMNGDYGVKAAAYGCYYWDGLWHNIRTGESHTWVDWQTWADWVNGYANWQLNQDIAVYEWDWVWNTFGAEYGHLLREAIAGRQGIIWLPTQTGMWWDTKSALSDNRTTDFTSANVVAWINDRKLDEGHRIAADGDTDVYVVRVPQPDIGWISIVSAKPGVKQ